MSISDGLRYVADLRITDVNGVPAIGFNRLQFSLEINIQATPGRTVELGSLTGFVYAASSPAGALKPLGLRSLKRIGLPAPPMIRVANL